MERKEVVVAGKVVSKPTVMEAVGRNLPTQPSTVTGKDGKHYPPKKRRKQASVFASNKKEEKRAVTAATMIEDAPDKVLPLRRAERIAGLYPPLDRDDQCAKRHLAAIRRLQTPVATGEEPKLL